MNPDVHAPYIAELKSAGDWAGLIRYAVGHVSDLEHAYRPALAAAIEILEGEGGRFGPLAAWLRLRLESPYEPIDLPDLALLGLDETQWISIEFARTLPWVALCELAGQFPAERQTPMFELGLLAANQWSTAAAALGDRPTAALAAHLSGRASESLGRLEDCEAGYAEALGIRRALAESRPEVYLSDVAMTLNNLGNVLRGLNRLEDSESAYTEALGIRRALANSRPEVSLPDVATTLNNLGAVLRGLNRLEESEAAYAEALGIRRALANSRPEVYRPDVAMTLNNLGIVLQLLNRLEDSESAYAETLGIYRALAKSRPEVYLPAVATTLNNLGTVLESLNRLEASESSFAEAMGIRRALANSRPEVYLPGLAMTLNNLGAVIDRLNRLEESESAYAEAVRIYRELAKSRPEVYLPGLAMTLNNLGVVLESLNRLEESESAYDEAQKFFEKLRERLGSSQLQERIALYHNFARLVLRKEPERRWPDWGRARELLREGTRLAERYRGMFTDPRERIRVQEEMGAMYRVRVEVCLKCGEILGDASGYAEAVEAAEASRARALLDALAQRILPKDAPIELQDEFRELQRDLRRAQRRLHFEEEVLLRLPKEETPAADAPPEPDDFEPELDAPEDTDRAGAFAGLDRPRFLRQAARLTVELAQLATTERIAAARAYIAERKPRYDALVAQLREFEPGFDPDRAVDSFRVEKRAAYFADGERGVYVLMSRTKEHVVLMIVAAEGPPIAVRATQLSAAAAGELVARSWAAQSDGRGTDEERFERLRATIAEIVRAIEPFVRLDLIPALERAGLEPGDRLVLVPDEILGFLPWHAATDAAGTNLSARYRLGQTPSLSILGPCLERPAGPPRTYFGIEDPTSTLPGAEPELAMAMKRFEEPESTRESKLDTLITGARRADVVHWIGHSTFSVAVPYWSGLVLDRSERNERTDPKTSETKNYPRTIIPRDLATFIDLDCGLTLENCSLAILSGCMSGLALPAKGSEPVSLVSALLHSGAKCVVASLWPVSDAACVLLIDRFLTAWLDDERTVIDALEVARTWLRELSVDDLKEWLKKSAVMNEKHRAQSKRILERIIHDHPSDHRPFAEPYYWAAFVAAGHGWEKPPAAAEARG
ncbi:MAG: CHAT domain-containing tetratricopeptide repeat protein [Isosphaeraceae bacterium]|nr:CHAT domain-containing tetratricopeptide repeat protein [Isosphaeraceae bacterium]